MLLGTKFINAHTAQSSSKHSQVLRLKSPYPAILLHDKDFNIGMGLERQFVKQIIMVKWMRGNCL